MHKVSVCRSSTVGLWDHQCSGVKRRPLEDPVKNGACSRNVAHRRWAKGRVRRLGSGKGRSSHGTLRPTSLQYCGGKKKPLPQKEKRLNYHAGAIVLFQINFKLQLVKLRLIKRTGSIKHDVATGVVLGERNAVADAV